MKRAILLLILATTCLVANAQRQVIYLPTQNGVEVTNVEDYRWVYATSAGCNVQIGPQTRVITATIPFAQIRDSLGRNFAQVTQRYFVGGTPSTRSALVQLKSIRNVITKGGYTTIQIRNPDQEYQVTESLQDVIDLVSFPIGDGSGVSGGGIITPDTLYIVNDGGGANPDTIIIDLSSLADGNGIFGVPDTVPSGMVATIDSGITFQGLQPTTFFNIDMDQGLYGTDYTQNDDTLKFRFYDLGSDSWIVVDANGIDIHSDGPDKIFLDGAVRVTDLVTDPATKLVGTDADGDLSSLVLGTNLSISGDTLNATSPPAGITGTGLATRIAAWTASGALGYDVSMVLDTVNNRMGVNTQAPVRTLDVTGTARISNLTTDTPTRLVGADADGDLGDAGSVGSAQVAFGGGNYIASSPTHTYAASNSGNNTTGLFVGPTLTATANNDAYAAFQVDGTFVPGAFTGTKPLIAVFSGSQTAAHSPYISITEGNSVTPPYISFYRNTTNNLSTGTLRTVFSGNGVSNVTPTFSASDDENGMQFALGNSSSLVYANLLGTGDVIPRAASITKTTHRFKGNLYAQEIIAGSDMDSGNSAVDGIIRSGQKNNTSTNIAGSNLTIQGGNGTGNSATGGNIIFQTPNLQASGTSLQTYVNAARFVRTTQNFLVGHTTDAVARLDVNSSGTTSASDAANFANSLDSTILRVRSDRRVGINTTTPDVSLDCGENTDQIKLPGGTTAQRAAVNNSIRYNSDVEGFEAREGGTWYRLTSSKTPAVTAGAGLGTGGTVSCVGNDLGGTVVFTTGTSAVAGDLFTLTFANAFDPAAQVTTTFSAKSTSAATAMTTMYIGVEGTTYFTLTSASALPDGTTHTINYKISQ